MMVHAVILAAGLGERLGKGLPKALVEIAPGRTLLDHQLELLGEAIGSEHITIVVGHKASLVERAANGVRCVTNERYAQTNTAKSLLRGIEGLPKGSDLLWLNGDLYFESGSLDEMLMAHRDGGYDGLALVLPGDPEPEAMRYALGEGGLLISEFGKQIDHAKGEALGMYMLRAHGVDPLRADLVRAKDDDYYEVPLCRRVFGQTVRMAPVGTGGHYSREIDFVRDLEDVREHVARGNG